MTGVHSAASGSIPTEQASNVAPQADLAATMFPERWAEALNLTGKRGNNRRRMIRRQAENEVIMIGLRATGASCGSCEHRDRRDGKLICDLDSDFHGYVIVKSDGLCPCFQKADR